MKPLSIIFRNCVDSTFPDRKEEIECMSHSQERWQTNNNYRPTSLLPIYGKVLEELIFNSHFEYLEEHNLLSDHLDFGDLMYDQPNNENLNTMYSI